MMFRTLLSLSLTMAASAAFSMPCDTGYSCVSKSGKYQLELQRCRYVNDLRVVSFNFNHKAVADAVIGPFWDGKSVGDSLLSFQVNWPSKGNSLHLISVEIPAHTMTGKLKEKFAESQPEPFRTLHSEAITCKISD